MFRKCANGECARAVRVYRYLSAKKRLVGYDIVPEARRRCVPEVAAVAIVFTELHVGFQGCSSGKSLACPSEAPSYDYPAISHPTSHLSKLSNQLNWY